MTAEAHSGPIKAGRRSTPRRRAAAYVPPLEEKGQRRRRLRFPSGSLTRRILAINLLVLAVPVGGFFFLDQYEQSLINREVEALREQGEIFAGALGSGGVVVTPGVGQRLEPARSSNMLRRLAAPTETRARLFSSAGDMLADTRALAAPRGRVHVEQLALPTTDLSLTDIVVQTFEFVVNWLPGRSELPAYRELPQQSAADYEEVQKALFGQGFGAVRSDGDRGIIISVAVPVQRYKQIVGAVMLSTDSSEIEAGLRAVRLDIIKVSGVAFAVTVLLSLYLAATIARPLRRLAVAAESVRRGQGRQAEIPDFSNRSDEIGELSRDLRQMTSALWQRMDAIEHFAADVAHEIKNPLTSLRSAVETTARVTDPDQQRRLMSIILEDVQRLDRLISDISDASRLDAELSRAETETLDIGPLLSALVEVERANTRPGAPRVTLGLPPENTQGEDLHAVGIEGRLGQVFRNVIANAVSFSPPDGRITCSAERHGDSIRVSVEDEGPGIPESKLDAIFDRFYSDRRVGINEREGTHSGLGLSISRQIIDAIGGRIWAENRRDAAGTIVGARFVVEVPAAHVD